MLTALRIPCRLLALAWLSLGPVSAIDLEGLVKNSPFGGTGAPAGPGVAPSTLEFRGMYAEGGVNYFSIYNTLTKQSSWVAEGEAPSTNVPVVVKGFDAANDGGQPQQMALHQAVVIAYKGPSAAQLAAVSNAVAQPSAVAGAPSAGGPGNLTPEQIEAFRQSMKDKFSKSRGPDSSTTSTKTPKTPAVAPATTTKPAKTPKIR